MVQASSLRTKRYLYDYKVKYIYASLSGHDLSMRCGFEDECQEAPGRKKELTSRLVYLILIDRQNRAFDRRCTAAGVGGGGMAGQGTAGGADTPFECP